jgi:hypothetical protein
VPGEELCVLLHVRLLGSCPAKDDDNPIAASSGSFCKTNLEDRKKIKFRKVWDNF